MRASASATPQNATPFGLRWGSAPADALIRSGKQKATNRSSFSETQLQNLTHSTRSRAVCLHFCGLPQGKGVPSYAQLALKVDGRSGIAEFRNKGSVEMAERRKSSCPLPPWKSGKRIQSNGKRRISGRAEMLPSLSGKAEIASSVPPQRNVIQVLRPPSCLLGHQSRHGPLRNLEPQFF